MLIEYDSSVIESDANVEYQACHNDQIYSAPDLKTLMDTMDKVASDAAAAKADPEVSKHLVTDTKLLRRLPVCNWRHRVGLDAAYPLPPNEATLRIVPASHSRPEFVEVKGAGGSVDTYIDEEHRRPDRIVILSPKGSLTIRPVYDDNDCPLFDRCQHFALGLEKQPERFDLHSLDDEPLSQSRVFEVDDTVDHLKSYRGCAGGRLYSGKNREEVEREVKDALENPAPPPVKGAPILGTPETSESGDIVIPDAFCDWTYRRKQAQALMNKSQGTPEGTR